MHEGSVSTKPSARGYPCPLARRSRRPSLAAVHCPFAALRPPGFACFRSSLEGTGTPSLVHRAGPQQRTVWQRDFTATGRKAPATKPEAQAEGTHVFGTPKRTATRRQNAANEHQRKDENLGVLSFRLKEKPTVVGVFRETRKYPGLGEQGGMLAQAIGASFWLQAKGLTGQPPRDRHEGRARAGRDQPAQLQARPSACRCPSALRTRWTS